MLIWVPVKLIGQGREETITWRESVEVNQAGLNVNLPSPAICFRCKSILSRPGQTDLGLRTMMGSCAWTALSAIISCNPLTWAFAIKTKNRIDQVCVCIARHPQVCSCNEKAKWSRQPPFVAANGRERHLTISREASKSQKCIPLQEQLNDGVRSRQQSQPK